MLVVKSLQQSNQMRRSRKHNKDVEYLVRIAPDVKGARLPSLRYACLQFDYQLSPLSPIQASFTHSIEGRASNIQHTLQHHPTQADLLSQLRVTV